MLLQGYELVTCNKFYNMTSEAIDSTYLKSNTFSQYNETIVML